MCPPRYSIDSFICVSCIDRTAIIPTSMTNYLYHFLPCYQAIHVIGTSTCR